MSAAAELLDAADRFLLREARVSRSRALAPLERKLERDVGQAFDVQRKGLLRRLARLRQRFPQEIREAIVPADWELLLDQALTAARTRFARALDRAASVAVQHGARAAVADSGVELAFTLANPRAVAFLADRGAARVTLVDEATRQDVRAILVRAGEEGWSYQRTAKTISDYFIGLRSAPPTRAEGKAIRSRARLIAVTEVGDAYEAGNLMAAEELEELGTPMEKSWLTAGDSRVSDGCRANGAAGWIPLARAFPSGDGRPLRHPGCRCALLTRARG